MRKRTRNSILAVMLATTCGAFAHADIPTGTDPVPPPTLKNSATSITIAVILEALTGVVL